MSGWIETELKLLLPDEAAWRRIREALGPGPTSEQENHFFDGEDGPLAAARVALRLRREGDRSRLTAKGAELATGDGALSRRIELEIELTSAEAAAALDAGLDLAAQLPRLEARAPRTERPAALHALLSALRAASLSGPLSRIDGFQNRRERLRLSLEDDAGPFSLALELDATRFPEAGRTDYELEVELEHRSGRGPGSERGDGLDPHRVEAALHRWLAGLGIAGVTAAPSKLARLRAARARPA